MIVFNTTYLVSEEIHDKWIERLASVFIPTMTNTGTFSNPRFYKVLVEEKDGITYSLQFSVPDGSDLKKCEKMYNEMLETSMRQVFGESVLYFTTLLDEIS